MSAAAPPIGEDARARAPSPADCSLREEGTPGDTVAVLVLSGRLDADGTSRVWQAAHAAVAPAAARPLLIDASALDYCDGAGIALVLDLIRSRGASTTRVRGLAPQYRTLLEQFDAAHFAPQPADGGGRRIHLLESLGERVHRTGDALIAQVAFLGEAAGALAHAIRRPHTVRWADAIDAALRVGAGALPIVALIAFLMGVIIAFQSAIPLRQYGGEIFVADLVGLSMLRELGPLMTAILLAGRTGAAFAAEIGTMKVNDEVSALTTMGLDPVRFLVVPRLLAAMIATPLLTIFADMVGLIGGALTMLAFSIPTVTYFNELSAWVGVGDFLSGWVKSFVFGTLIAGIGCARGLATRNDATAVGESTTDAVVASIIMIVVVDGIFALLYFQLDV